MIDAAALIDAPQKGVGVALFGPARIVSRPPPLRPATRLLPARYGRHVAKLIGVIRTTETRQITVEVDERSEAIEMLRAQVPEGYQLLAVRREK